MLNFEEWGAPVLPVHDSFIVHHGYAWTGEIEEIMRRAYYEEVGEQISKVDTEILTWTYRKDNSSSDEQPTLDAILDADDDVASWKRRHELWQRETLT